MACEDTQPPPGAAPDLTYPQDWACYIVVEHAMWDRLFARQSVKLPGLVQPGLSAGSRYPAAKPGISHFESSTNASTAPPARPFVA